MIDAGALPHGCDNCTATSLGDWLFVTGGRDGADQRRDTVLRGDVTLQDGSVAWLPQTPLPAARDNHALAADEVGSQLLAVGGNDAAGNPTASVFRAQVDAGGVVSGWEQLPDLTEAVRQHEAFVHAGTLYVVGSSLSGQQRRVRRLALTGPADSPVCP